MSRELSPAAQWELRLAAYHEAGHAMVHLVHGLPLPVVVHRLSFRAGRHRDHDRRHVAVVAERWDVVSAVAEQLYPARSLTARQMRAAAR